MTSDKSPILFNLAHHFIILVSYRPKAISSKKLHIDPHDFVGTPRSMKMSRYSSSVIVISLLSLSFPRKQESPRRHSHGSGNPGILNRCGDPPQFTLAKAGAGVTGFLTFYEVIIICLPN
jgi:hypothetical protein